MRQIHNANPQQADKRMKEFTEAGLIPANIAWLIPYLDTTQPENPALLEKAVRQSPANLTQDQSMALGLLLDRLISRGRVEDQERNERTVKAFFSIFGVSLMQDSIVKARPWLSTGAKILDVSTPLEKLLGPGAALALKASYWRGGSGPANSLRLSAKPGVIEDAMSCCTDPNDPARIILACLWLGQQGTVDTLLGAATGKNAQMIKLAQEGAANFLPEAAPALNYANHSFLDAYIRNAGTDAQDIPPQIAGPIGSLGSRNSNTSAVGSALFYAMEAAPVLQNAFIAYAHLNPGLTLRMALELAGPERFKARLPWLVRHIPAFSAVLFQLCNTNGFYRETALQIARDYPEQFAKAMKGKQFYDIKYLQEVLAEANPEQFRQLQDSKRPGIQAQAAEDLSKEDPKDPKALRDFILHGTGLDAILASHTITSNGVRTWSGPGWSVLNYAENYGLDGFLARCFIAMAVNAKDYHFYRAWNDACRRLPQDMRTMETVLDAVRGEGLPAFYCLILSEWEDQHSYSQKDKSEIMDQTASWMLKQPPELLAEAAEKGSAYIRTLAVHAYWQKGDYDALLPLAGDSSKQVRKAVEDAFTSRPFAEGPKAALELLQSKKAAPRETGIRILMNLESKASSKGAFIEVYHARLEEALAKEKSVKLANALRALLGLEQVEAEGKSGGEASLGDPVAEVLKGGKKRKVQWVLDGTAQLVSRAPGGALADAEDRLAAIMLLCQDGGPVGARNLAEPLEARELAAFAGAVYDLWISQNAPSKQKWVLTFASVFGGHDMVETLKKQINQWPLESRGAIACEAVNALALSPEPDALLVVDSISRKFKFKQVKAAAGKALDAAAKVLGLSAEELADRIVPDLGLDQRGQRVFSYGPRSFTVTLTPALELEIRNQDGKKIKSMPAPGKQDDPELAGGASADFKAMKKQIKTAVSTQSLRLEQALSTGRVWTGTGWRALFVEKPIMRQFAVGLIWGVYGPDGALTGTFRYLEDGSFNTVDEDEYELAGDARVGLVHPVELEKEALDAWRQQLEDYEITQPILQLDRPVSRVTPEEADETSLGTFGGRVLNDMSLTGKLLGMGWYRGSVQDAGGFYDFYREDGPIGAQLNFSGSFVGGGMDGEAEVFDIQFYRSGTVQRGSYVYDTLGQPQQPGQDFTLVGGAAQSRSDSRLFKLGDVPARLFSEIVYQVQKATASSTETRSDWRTRT